MIDLTWYALLGGALILGTFVFGLARIQQWRFSRRYENSAASDPAAVAKVEGRVSGKVLR